MKDKSWKAFCKEMPGSHSFHGFLQLFGNLPCSYLHFSFWAEGPIDSPWQSLESMAKKNTSKSYCNIFAMNHWVFLKRLWTEFMDENLCFATCFSTKNMVKKKLPNLIAISLQWTTECFWSDCGQNLWIQIFVLQHVFRPKTWWKKLLNLIAIVWTWPTECFKSNCEHNSYIQNYSNMV